VPAYTIFHDATLRAMAEQQPHSERQLAAIHGVGAAKLERYAAAVLRLLGESAVA
jgi:superfamily II DNA helicase RecQ